MAKQRVYTYYTFSNGSNFCRIEGKDELDEALKADNAFVQDIIQTPFPNGVVTTVLVVNAESEFNSYERIHKQT